MTNHSNENSRKRNDLSDRIIGATVLIGLGIIFLLNTSGILPWSFWGNFWSIVWRLWPFFLIFAGVHIIIGKHKIFNLVVGVIFALLIATVALISVLASIPSLGVKEALNNTFPTLFTNTGESEKPSDSQE